MGVGPLVVGAIMSTSSSRVTSDVACDECGALVPEGKAGCQELFDEVLAREFGDYRYGRLHRLTVDTYSLQHPRQYMRSGKSFAAHLTGMYAALEGEDTSPVNQAVQRWLNGPKVLHRPAAPPPLKRGDLTIVYLHGAAGAEEHLQRVRVWARSTWDAWSGYRGLARQWIDQAIFQCPSQKE
ncbi:MAG: DUF5946 family protein [Acidobacteriota bacterium]